MGCADNSQNQCSCNCSCLNENQSCDLEYSLTIDGQKVGFVSCDTNLVDVAARAGITIPAPCFRNERFDECCKICLVEINGKHAYACSTKPEEGMNIVVLRNDLNEIRKQSVIEFKKKLKENSNAAHTSSCSCGCNH